MDTSKLRLLIAQAREDDEKKATPGPWGERDVWLRAEVDSSGRCTRGTYVVGFQDVRFIANARSREPLLARALEAALDVVQAADHFNSADIRAALARFRAAVEGEA